MQGVFLKCAEFLPTRLWNNVEDEKQLKKIVAQKINVILFFDIEFFKYFFRVLHEASSSWLKFLHNLQNYPVFLNFSLVIAKELRIYGLIYETTK
jgi:hypothetical protein